MIMILIKRLIEIIYYETNHDSEKSHDIFPVIGFFLSLSIAFVVPILGTLLGFELMCITYVFIFTPLMIFSIFLYFRFHHEEIMNNEEYQNFKNRKRIIKTTLVISALACAPLMLLLTLILNNL